jgi:hypothetical protein
MIPEGIIAGTVIKEHTKWRWNNIRTYLSVCIRVVLQTDKNHVAIALPLDGELYVFEAWKCVRPVKLEHWFRDENRYSLIPPAKNFDLAFACAKAKDMMGWTEYNYVNTLFYQLIYRLSGCRWWIGPSGDRANKTVECAQFVGILQKRDNPERLSPKEFN